MTIRELINSTVQFYHDYLYTVTNENILDWSISYIFLSLFLAIVGFIILSIAWGMACGIYEVILEKPVKSIYRHGNTGVKKLHKITGSEKLLNFLEQHLGNALGGLIWGILVFVGMYVVILVLVVFASKI